MNHKIKIDPKIFRAYDVRGLYGTEINQEVCRILAKVFARHLNKKKGQVVVGRDLRSSSPSLFKVFVQELNKAGLDVLDVGKVTTPMFFFAAAKLKAIGGAIITASHNPPEYNGVKFVGRGASPIGGKELWEVYNAGFDEKKPTGKGRIKKVDISSEYLDKVTKNFKITRRIKMRVDGGGGAVKLFLSRFLKKISQSNSAAPKTDISFSFDFDGDRLYVFDENRREVKSDLVGAIVAGEFVKKGGSMLADMICTRALEDYFEREGIKVYRAPVGHHFIRKAMIEKKADFAVELSGHYYFKNFYFSDSALFAARLVLEALDSHPGMTISELAARFGKYCHSGVINLPLANREQLEIVLGKLKEKYKDGKQNFDDEILVKYPRWWFSVRPSSTEPVIRLVVEADSKELMEEKKEEIALLLK